MTNVRFYWHRLRALRERVVDWLFDIDERCEGCRRPLIIHEMAREPVLYDSEGVPLCGACAVF